MKRPIIIIIIIIILPKEEALNTHAHSTSLHFLNWSRRREILQFFLPMQLAKK
jgi:hypothetical protein